MWKNQNARKWAQCASNLVKMDLFAGKTLLSYNKSLTIIIAEGICEFYIFLYFIKFLQQTSVVFTIGRAYNSTPIHE